MKPLSWALGLLVSLSALASDPTAQRFPSPVELAVSRDGSRLFALCEGTDEVVAYDTRSAQDHRAHQSGTGSERPRAVSRWIAAVRG